METAIVNISRRKLSTLVNDTTKAAAYVNLVHVSDSAPGITRIRKGKGFAYLQNGRLLKDKKALERIHKLVIPPAWEQVWICAVANGHLQATGVDQKKRKQYIYHPVWHALRNHTKFSHLYEFGNALPALRARIHADMALPGMPADKVLGTLVAVMQTTSIRVGNGAYEKLYGSYGLTTLKNKHVEFKDKELLFRFIGKKGVAHNISLRNKKLIRIIQQCHDIPGRELFQYYDEQKQHCPVDSGMVNNYIRAATGGDFTAKDFRTWTGSLHALAAFRELGLAEDEAIAKKKVVEVLDKVATELGNTRTVCRKYYVHPLLIDLYMQGKLDRFWTNPEAHAADGNSMLEPDEQGLMNLLKSSSATISL
jgi:DNA topoisomerase-1